MRTENTPVVLLQLADLKRIVQDPETLDKLREANLPAEGFVWGNHLGQQAVHVLNPKMRGG